MCLGGEFAVLYVQYVYKTQAYSNPPPPQIWVLHNSDSVCNIAQSLDWLFTENVQ